jgi:peptidoglycan/LPS O-acetylase OafA/YrhL
MTRGFSTYLDGARAAAAILVLLSHMGYGRFTGGDLQIIRDFNLGSDAVVIFFVLSGFVIAYAADQRDAGFGGFAFNRMTRLWSVAIPALALTLAADALGSHLAPADYDGWWHHKAPSWLTAPMALGFFSEWTGFGFRIGTNGPWWSLSYEAAYYILFAIFTYMTGARRVMLLVLAVLLIGVKPMLLLPSWLLGVAVYRLLKQADAPTNRLRWQLLAALPVVLYALLQSISAPLILELWGKVTFGPVMWGLRFSDEPLWNLLIGALFALHLYAVGRLMADANAERRLISNTVKWLAGASFSIYLVHYPLLMLFDVFIPNFAPAFLHHIILFAVTLAVCLLFAQAFERPLPRFRALLRKRPAPAEHVRN